MCAPQNTAALQNNPPRASAIELSELVADLQDYSVLCTLDMVVREQCPNQDLSRAGLLNDLVANISEEHKNGLD